MKGVFGMLEWRLYSNAEGKAIFNRYAGYLGGGAITSPRMYFPACSIGISYGIRAIAKVQR